MMLLPLPPPPLPLKIFAVIIFVLLLSSSPLDINRSGLLIFAEASRAYPHGCLYRHPSYYTYDERDDIDGAEFHIYGILSQGSYNTETHI